jgi:hypothetical protein
MPLPQHPDRADTPAELNRSTKRRGIAIAVGVLLLMATIHLLRQAF